jgi:hypothetical protein
MFNIKTAPPTLAAGHAEAGLGAFGRGSDSVNHGAVRREIRRYDRRGANHE